MNSIAIGYWPVRMKYVDAGAQQYWQMTKNADIAFCWCCGRGQGDRPADWFAPWKLQRAHIVQSPRIEDRRVVILSCPLCHHAGIHGERIVTSERDGQWPRLELEHLLWIKLKHDPLIRRLYQEDRWYWKFS